MHLDVFYKQGHEIQHVNPGFMKITLTASSLLGFSLELGFVMSFNFKLFVVGVGGYIGDQMHRL